MGAKPHSAGRAAAVMWMCCVAVAAGGAVGRGPRTEALVRASPLHAPAPSASPAAPGSPATLAGWSAPDTPCCRSGAGSSACRHHIASCCQPVNRPPALSRTKRHACIQTCFFAKQAVAVPSSAPFAGLWTGCGVWSNAVDGSPSSCTRLEHKYVSCNLACKHRCIEKRSCWGAPAQMAYPPDHHLWGTDNLTTYFTSYVVDAEGSGIG